MRQSAMIAATAAFPARLNLKGEKMTDQITLTAESPEWYERGRIVAHTSDDSGIADVGLSVGLGGGFMLYAGDMPGDTMGWGLALFGQHEKQDVARNIDGEAAREMIERIAGAICSSQS
jgi:hypothetical protein